MSIEELLRALEWLKVETGSLACLGCEYENNCGMHGCRILREVIACISILEQKEPKKPLSAFLQPIDRYKGLKRKFLVFKSDTGEIVENCFVLRPGKDPAAVEALRAYAEATDNKTLSEDIINWVGKPVEYKQLQKAIKMLESEYERASHLDFVHDPLAYALYHVWKNVDRRR